MDIPPPRATRSYQAWIANETLEDYSLRYAAESFRKWSPWVIANTALGGISFLALEAIGGVITLNYGFANALPAIAIVSFLIFLISIPIAYYAARYNIDMDLLTRGAGFGYIGSTITSLTYVTFTFIFFALEGAILAQAMKICIGIPLVIGYIVSSLVIIPITFMGVTMISRLQRVTQPLWLVMLITPFVVILVKKPSVFENWIRFHPSGSGGHFSFIAFGMAVSLLCSLVIQIGEQVDYLRFLPNRTAENRIQWWATVLMAGPGWILIGGLKILFGSFLAVLVIDAGLPRATALEPIHMYIQAYSYLSGDPKIVLILAAIFVLVSQIKINVTNAYAGSLAWSNFFSRVTHYHPGRVVWLIFNILISLLLMLLGIFNTLSLVLTVYSNVAIAWIGAIFADLAILKPLGVSPPFIEFKRAHLHNINPVGCGAMAIASVTSLLCFAGTLGPGLQAYSAPLSFGISLVAAVAIGFLTRGRYYLARSPSGFERTASGAVRCEICSHDYERSDMAWCSFYEQPICSLCCSLDAHCHDICKAADGSTVRLHRERLGRLLEEKIAPRMGQRLAKVCGILFALAVVTGAVILLTYRLTALDGEPTSLDASGLLVRIYVAVLPLLAVGAWWVVLAHESRELAERDLVASLDMLRSAQHELAQNERLAAIGELTATVSHELRNPLGTLVSSIGLLRRSIANPPTEVRGELDRIERNIWRCNRIIEELLEFSRRREPIYTPIVIDNWIAQHLAEQRGLETIRVELSLCSGATIRADAERLHQAFVNVVLNAIQAIEAREIPGTGILRIATRMNDGTLLLSIADNGPGMPVEIRQRIFEPLFSTKAFGVGLGMPLVKRVMEQHDGSVLVESEVERGTKVILRLPLRAHA
ncbi:ATP-binding protein [Acidiphilium iwatense]|uniref:histidine kinase n=1 Tax=Acidiphilium iwatense TaxID=768198 RepID=A0ABS9E114_9PROT|nr:ATP-binding protein [Acidiphilium iwatense]MCF3948696.1 ATP-binding protein [Acidiphilium iwatense]